MKNQEQNPNPSANPAPNPENNPPETVTEESAEALLGPPKMTFIDALLKVVVTGVGGAIGSILILLITLLVGSILTNLSAYQTEVEVNTISIFILMVTVFVSALVSNIASIFMIGLNERDRYKRLASSITQTFLANVMIFLLLVPVYFIATAVDITLVYYVTAFHVIISAQTSALILEIVSNYRHSLIGLYGIILAILIAASILLGLVALELDLTILFLALLPVVWLSIGLMQSLVTMVYGGLARIYDKDFLSTQTLYGRDYGKEVENTELPEEEFKADNEAGTDFLKKL